MSYVYHRELKVFYLGTFIILIAGCANIKLINQRITQLEEENAALRKETTDINIKLEETNNILYVIQDKMTEQTNSIEELKKSISIKTAKENPVVPERVQTVNSAEERYRAALDLLHSGKIDAAEQGFREFRVIKYVMPH